jgi:hypothetical protein
MACAILSTGDVALISERAVGGGYRDIGLERGMGTRCHSCSDPGAESELKACRRINAFTAASRTPTDEAGRRRRGELRHAAQQEEIR